MEVIVWVLAWILIAQIIVLSWALYLLFKSWLGTIDGGGSK